MRKIVFIAALLLSFFASHPLLAQGEAQQNPYHQIDSLMNGFFKLLERATEEDKCAEVDFLISTCQDSLTRQHIALKIFDHYRDSYVMGDENVAIYVYDKWFESGKVSFMGEMDRMDAEMYVRFNRQSLIGCEAPSLVLRKPCCGTKSIPVRGHTSVLFFFDTQCEKCRIVASLMPKVMKTVDFEVDLCMIYCGSDGRAWRQFRRAFKIDNKKVRVSHLWDPELDSNYPLKYSVIGTPRIYCIEPQGTIIGRRLEIDSLLELLKYAGAIQATYDKYAEVEDYTQ